MHELIRDIAVCTVAAWLLALVGHWFRQPALLAYLFAGFILGTSGSKLTGMHLVHSLEAVEAVSELGLIFLLFMIGLEIDLKKIASAGKSITVTALVQIGGGIIIGIGFFALCGFPLSAGRWDALYLGMAGALSSTVIIVKVLYDKHELDTLTGRITLGVLVLQDLAAILFLAVQPNLDNLNIMVLLASLGRAALLVCATLIVSRFVLPPLFKRVARVPELLQVGAIAWCLFIGEFGEFLHLSREMGALVAGVALSTYPYAVDVTAKVTSLRDFFITLFFVGLGMRIPMPTWTLVGWAVVFAVFVMLSRFLTVFSPLFLMKQGMRTGIVPAINLSQVSEFSLVVLALGVSANHLSRPETSGMVALAFVALATLSTMMMGQSDGITRRLIPILKKRGLKDLDHSKDDVHATGTDGHGKAGRIVFLGFFRTASSLLEEMQRHAPDLIGEVSVVDFSPVARSGLLKRDVHVIYGDIAQRDTLVHAGVDKAEVIVSSVPNSLLKGTDSVRLVRMLRGISPTAKIIATADVLSEVPKLIEAGANYVSIGRLYEADDLLAAVRAATEGLLDAKREEVLKRLTDRSEVLA